MQKEKLSKENLRNAPETPGVYIFWGKGAIPLYIGKSNNLRRRIESYLSGPLTPKTAQMINKATFYSLIRVASELEALLLEAKLVKANQPKYNSQLKDDKHPLYIRITKEKYPRIITARKQDGNGDTFAFFGPFPSSSNVKSVLKMLRRILPFSQHKIGKKPCLYSQIGLCNPCPSYIEATSDGRLKKTLRKSYSKNIKMINSILSGKLNFVRSLLTNNMLKMAREEKFEEAKTLREQIERLDYITAPITPASYFLKNPNLLEDIRKEESQDLKTLIGKFAKVPKVFHKIECFDVAHMGGDSPTASMVTFINGEPEKSLYRHFRIRYRSANDISSMKEVAQRRERNLPTWGIPDLIIVDGGKAQAGVFSQVFSKHNVSVIGLAKRFETVIVPQASGGFTEIRTRPGKARNLLVRLRNEAHRFARRYHHLLLKKQLLANI